MDGKWMKKRLSDILSEDDDSDFLSDRISYNFLYEAAIEFVSRTKCLKGTQTLTTVVDQTDYTLDARFLQLWMRDKGNRLFLTYNDGSLNSWIYFQEYEDMILEDNTTSVVYPTSFSILDEEDLGTQITGLTTADGAASGGVCILTDSGGGFDPEVSIGDVVHNTTDESDGIVLSITSDTALNVALFDGTENDWTSGDSYVIQPQGRLKLILDPPPSTAGHTITVSYIKRPDPVYSDYGVYRFQQQYASALLKYAAWLYKYRDQEANFGDAFFIYWDRMVKSFANQLSKNFERVGMRVSFKKRRGG